MSEGQPKKRRWRMTRRGFLISAGVTTATLAVGVAAGLPKINEFMGENIDKGAGSFITIENAPNSWFEITADNEILFFIPKVEMGQGIHTVMAQIGADELEVRLDQMTVLQASTARGFGNNSQTGNSDSISTTYMPIREAAAALRETLKLEAANQLGVTVAELSVGEGEIWATAVPNNRLSYGDIIQEIDIGTIEVPEEIPLKDRNAFNYIGTAVPRIDFKSKLMGEAIYGYDAKLPNMLYGAVARPPKIEATLKEANEGTAVEVDGVVTVVAEDDFAGVVATSRQAAYSGVRNMDVTWEEGHLWQQEELDELVTVGNGKAVTVQREGNVAKNLTGNIVMGEYRTPFAAHAHLEPQAALVDVQPDKVTAWVSTQSPDIVRRDVANAVDMDVEQVEIIPTYLGSGLGRKLNVEVAIEAAKLSKAAGQPVHVGWNRTEDMRYGFFRPPTHHQLTGSLGDDGRIQSFLHEQASGDSLFLFFPLPLQIMFGADIGAYRGGFIQYDNVPNRQLIAHRIKLPIPTGPWRGLGLLANTFAVESFVDEMAHVAGADPLQYRLDHFGNSDRSVRFKDVLIRAAEMAGWGGSLPEGHALGIACNVDVQTVVAQVAEVSVDDGRIQVHKVTSVVDPGMVINPDGATAQTQGAIMMGLSSTFFEEITVKNGIIEASNFDRYPLLTMKEAPDIAVEFIESGTTPFGMGEPPIGPVAAAVGNAVFSLTGQRIRKLPMRLEDI